MEVVHCFYRIFTNLSDFIPLAAFDERLFDHPSAAHAENVLSFCVLADIFSCDAASWHECALWERTAEVVDDFVSTLALSREEFEMCNALVDAGSDF